MPESQPIDISKVISSETPVWPGDQSFSARRNASLQQGDSVNLSSWTMSAHIGSHADAPYHVSGSGSTIEAVNLATYWGLAQLVTVTKQHGVLRERDFDRYDLLLAPRLLVRTPVTKLPQDRLPEVYPFLDAQLVDFLESRGVILYGTDAPSMDAFDSSNLPAHHALIRKGIAIIEGLDLRTPADGLYELVALPLRIAGADGSPVRAALRPLATGP